MLGSFWVLLRFAVSYSACRGGECMSVLFPINLVFRDEVIMQ